MPNLSRLIAASCLVFALGACGSDSSSPAGADAGANEDGSSTTDGGSTSDAEGGDDGGTEEDAGSGEDGGGEDAGPTEDVGDLFTSYIRVINLSPNVPNISVYIEGEAPEPGSAFDDIAYLETGPSIGDAEAFVALESGNYNIAFVPAGSTPEDTPLRVDNTILSPDARYTVYIYGDADVDGGLGFNVSVDDTSIETAQTQTGEEVELMRIRAFNTLTESVDVDFDVNGEEGRTGILAGFFNQDYWPPASNPQVADQDYTITLKTTEGGEVLGEFEATMFPGSNNLYFVGNSTDGVSLLTLTMDNQLNLYD